MPEEGIIVKVQKMFPNCQKYPKCCTETPSPPNIVKVDIPIKKVKLKITKPPPGFKGW